MFLRVVTCSIVELVESAWIKSEMDAVHVLCPAEGDVTGSPVATCIDVEM